MPSKGKTPDHRALIETEANQKSKKVKNAGPFKEEGRKSGI